MNKDHIEISIVVPMFNEADNLPGNIDKIRAALKIGYDISDLKTAIDGCMKTPHNIGKNDRGQVYDGLHIILKDADQIDRFMGNAKKPPKVEQAHHQSSAYAPFKAE